MGQFERALNRLYGIEADRPSVEKYTRAFVLTITVGVLVVLAFVCLAFGRAIGEGLEDNPIADIWAVVRWPLALAAHDGCNGVAVPVVTRGGTSRNGRGSRSVRASPCCSGVR